MKKALLTVLSAVSLFGLAVAVQATPWFTQDPRTLPAGKWRVEEHVLYSDINNGLADGQEIPLPGGASNASALTLHTRVRYGVRDDLTVFVDLPYVSRRVHTPGGPLENSGLGDLTFLAKYKYQENKEQGRRNAVAAFYKPHNGDYKGMPGLLATGSGQDNIGVAHLWEWRMGDDQWYAKTGWVWRDSRSDTGLDPGDLFMLDLAAEHKVGDSGLNFVWEINGRFQDGAKQAGQPVPNTSSSVISLSPGLQYVQKSKSGPIVTYEAGVQVPVITEGGQPALPDYTIYAGAYAVF